MIRKLLQKSGSKHFNGSVEVDGLLTKRYLEQVESGRIQYDPAQVRALQILQALMEKLLADVARPFVLGFKRRRNTARRSCRNLYLFGDVGHGKSMLMDLFYENCPIAKKRRVHFHTFMLEVHEFSHQFRKHSNSDVILALAEKIHAQTLLLCFDEFHVIDVANAVILDRLFSRLYELGTVIVSTSNRHPDDLYQGGITPELFLSFIKLLKQVSDIVELTGDKDYRLLQTQAQDTAYYTPIDHNTTALLKRRYRNMTGCSAMTPSVLTVLGRRIALMSAHGDVALSSFQDLCGQPLGPADYLKITHQFRTLILLDIPKLGADRHDEAKRFSTLIDALYFHHVVLICSAEVPVHKLYDKEHCAFFLKRTVSRLIEMQSKQYIDSA